MNLQLLFGARSPDSTRASLAVTLCGRKSLLVQTTVSPAATSRRSGMNFIPSMRTACGVPAAWAPAADSAATQTRTSAARRFTGLFLRQGRLDHFGVVQVRRDGGADLGDEVLQLRVLGVWNQNLVDRVQDLLVIRHLVVGIRPVERGTLQSLEMRHVFAGIALQALAGGAIFGCHAEFLHKRGGLFVDRGMVGNHELRELRHLLVLGVGLGKLARVDVDLVGCNYDSGDLRIGRSAFVLGGRGDEEKRGCQGDGDFRWVHGFSNWWGSDFVSSSFANTPATMRSQRAPAKANA